MTADQAATRPAGRHPLHPSELVTMSWRTFRQEPARVAVPALVIFGLDALQSTFFTEIAVDRLGWEWIFFVNVPIGVV